MVNPDFVFFSWERVLPLRFSTFCLAGHRAPTSGLQVCQVRKGPASAMPWGPRAAPAPVCGPSEDVYP